MDNYFDQLDDDLREEPINWRDIFEKLVSHWKWFVVSIILSIIAGFVFVRMQPDVYEVKSSLLVIDQSRSGQMNEMSVLKQLDAAGLRSSGSTAMINNEDKVLTSTTLMKRVVDELELHTTYTQTEYLKHTDLYKESPLYVRLDSVSLYSLKYSLNLNVKPQNGKLVIEGNYFKTDFTQEIEKLPAVIKTPAGVIYMQIRPGFEFPEKNIVISIIHPFACAKSIVNSALKTEVGKLLDVIDLSYKGTNSQKGKDILTTLVEVYNQDASEQTNLSAINTARFIDTRLELLSSELSDVEREVETYKQTNKLTEISEDAKIFQEKNSMYDQLQIEVEMQQNLIKYIDEFLRDPSNSKALVPNLGLTDAGLVAVIQAYNELVMNRERISVGVSDENPSLKTLNVQINAARRAILTSITSTRKGLQISKSDLSDQNAKMQSKILNIPRQEREFVEIKRQQQVKATLFTFLLQKREEATLNMAVAVPKGRILNAPDDSLRVSPKRNLILLVFLFIGLIFPAILIYILDLLNTSIQSRVDVEKFSKIPVITELTHSSSDHPLIDLTANASANSELFRLLRTKLQFALEQPKEKVVLITSTMSGEGKTFVSVNLAAMLSLTDKKVLVIGMDLRRPQLAKVFNLSEVNGITLYLSGQVNDINKVISKSEDYPNLYILPAGVIPPNPSELIMKQRFENLINELRELYDYIVIDSAPVGAVSDTFLIDRVADITLYVCRARYTDKRYLEFANRAYNEKSLKRMYFILNDVDVDIYRYSYNRKYGFGYGYGYGYGYGKENQNTK